MTNPETIERTTACLLDEAGVSFSVAFVPNRTPETPYPLIHWCATLTRGKASHTFAYHQGIGHLPAPLKPCDCPPRSATFVDAMKRRAVAAISTGMVGSRWGALSTWHSPQPLVPPTASDVLYCLVSDASVLDYPTFEEWASDCGYGPDSRDGERIYRACIVNALKLRALFGDSMLEKMRECLQDL